MLQATKDPAYKSSTQAFISSWLASNNRISTAASASGSEPQEQEVVGIIYTPKGLAKAAPGGTLQHTANAAFLVLAAADAGVYGGAKFMRHACWVRNQIGYMLVS